MPRRELVLLYLILAALKTPLVSSRWASKTEGSLTVPLAHCPTGDLKLSS